MGELPERIAWNIAALSVVLKCGRILILCLCLVFQKRLFLAHFYFFEEVSKLKSSVLVDLANCLATTPDYLLGFEKESDPISESVIAVLSSIKDERWKNCYLTK